MTTKHTSRYLFLGLLLLLGVLGNAANVTLFYGVDFLFGGIFVWLILRLFGLYWGIGAALIIHSYTVVLWGHPYAWIIFVIETIVVGYVLTHQINRHILILDFLFWVALGLPLVWVFYSQALSLEPTGVLLVLLKQAINGMFNIGVAGICLLFVPWHTFLPLDKPIPQVTMRDMTVTILGFAIFLTGMSATIINARLTTNRIHQTVLDGFERVQDQITEQMYLWLEHHLAILHTVNDVATQHWHDQSVLQQTLQHAKQSAPDFYNMYIADSSATTIAFYPSTNPKGQSTIGLNFADRAYFHRLRQGAPFVVSDVFQGRGGIFEPIITMSLPIRLNGTFRGYSLAAIKLDQLQRYVTSIITGTPVDITMLDQDREIIFSTHQSFNPLEQVDTAHVRTVDHLNGQLTIAEPGRSSKAAIKQWGESVYYSRVSLGEPFQWHLIATQPISFYQHQLYVSNNIHLLIALGLFLGLYGFAFIIGHLFTRPIETLVEIAHDLPAKASTNARIHWPTSRIRETAQLITSLQSTKHTLADHIQQLQTESAEHQQTAQELRQSETRFRNVVESIGEGLLITDFDDRILYANDSICDMTGYSQDELEGSLGYELLLGDQGKTQIEHRHRERKKGRAEVYEIPIHHKDGSQVWARIYAVPYRGTDGALIGTLGAISDISELKAMQTQLERQNQALNILTAAGEAIVRAATVEELYSKVCWIMAEFGTERAVWAGTLTQQGTYPLQIDPIAHWGEFPKACIENPIHIASNDKNAHPMSKALIQGSPERLFPDSDAHQIYSQFQEQLPHHFDHPHIMVLPLIHEGTHVGVLCLYQHQPFFEEEVQIYHTLAEDVAYGTLAIRKNEELERNLKQMRLQSKTLNSMINAIVITNNQGKIEYVNPAFTKLTGYTREEVLGENPRILKSGKHTKAFYQQLWETILAGETWSGEFINRKKDGTLYHIYSTITPVINDNGAITHFIASKQDITEKKQLENQLIQAQKMEALGQIAGGIAHDFNNVLATVDGARQMLSLTQDDPAASEKYFSMIQSSIERGKGITDRMLTFTRTEEPEVHPISVMKILHEVKNITSHTFPKGVEYETTPFEESDLIAADKNQIEQVLLNLCINAADAMDGQGKITFSLDRIEAEALRIPRDLTPTDTYLKLSIADTGCGIPADKLDQIFEPFYTSKPQGKGTGLGLAVVQKIIQNHHGWVEVESEVDQGTRFDVYLPAVQPEIDSSVDPADSDAPRGNGEHILIVDDERQIREVLLDILKNMGYEVNTAPDASEALNLFASAHDLVLTDLGLPGLSGVQFAEALFEIDPDIKIIAMTGYIDPEESKQLQEVGFATIIQKPFNLEELLSTIHQTLHP